MGEEPFMKLSPSADVSHMPPSSQGHMETGAVFPRELGQTDGQSSLICLPPQGGLLVFLLHVFQAEAARGSRAGGRLPERGGCSQAHHCSRSPGRARIWVERVLQDASDGDCCLDISQSLRSLLPSPLN